MFIEHLLTTNINFNKAPFSIWVLTTIYNEIMHDKHYQYGLMIDGAIKDTFKRQ